MKMIKAFSKSSNLIILWESVFPVYQFTSGITWYFGTSLLLMMWLDFSISCNYYSLMRHWDIDSIIMYFLFHCPYGSKYKWKKYQNNPGAENAWIVKTSIFSWVIIHSAIHIIYISIWINTYKLVKLLLYLLYSFMIFNLEFLKIRFKKLQMAVNFFFFFTVVTQLYKNQDFIGNQWEEIILHP